jgi:Protein of unknown function (DUF3761)
MLAFLPRRCWPCLADQAGHALAFSCNNNHNVNSSGHVVHAPSCDEEHEQRTAECRDGRLSFSEHPSEHARITVEWNTGIEERSSFRRDCPKLVPPPRPRAWRPRRSARA